MMKLKSGEIGQILVSDKVTGEPKFVDAKQEKKMERNGIVKRENSIETILLDFFIASGREFHPRNDSEISLKEIMTFIDEWTEGNIHRIPLQMYEENMK